MLDDKNLVKGFVIRPKSVSGCQKACDVKKFHGIKMFVMRHDVTQFVTSKIVIVP